METSEEKTPGAARQLYDRYKVWWDDFGFIAHSFMVLAVIVCGVLTWQATVTNGRQDKERDEIAAALLDCFDDRDAYATESATVLRNKTQLRDDAVDEKAQAVREFSVAVGEWTGYLVTALNDPKESNPEDLAKFVKLTAEIQSTSQVVAQKAELLSHASEELTQARVDNPVVPPASELCKTGVFVPPVSVKESD